MNSSPYAGDVRKLEAIDLPELHCLKDVIVFSTKGDRKLYYYIIKLFSSLFLT